MQRIIMNAKSCSKAAVLFFAILYLLQSARAETFIFIAQPDPPPSGPVNFSWFSANNWFTNDPVSMSLKHANTLPAPGDTAQIDGGVNAAANTIHLDTLILTANAAVSGGDFICSKVQMHGGSGGGTTSFTSSTVEVLTEMDVFGGSCAFNSSALNIDFGATCFMGLAGTGQLTLGNSQLFNAGQIVLYPNSASEITGGTNFVNAASGTVEGGSNTLVTISGNVDANGVFQGDSGTLSLSATTWSSTTGKAIFRTMSSNAVISFVNTLTVPPNATNIFEGPGISSLQNGANVQGSVLVGLFDSSSQTLDPGNLQFANQVGGTGTVEVVALPSTPSFLIGNSNVSGTLAGLTVTIDAGGKFNIGYNLNSLSLTLNGATINNSGVVTWGGQGTIAMSGNATLNNLAAGLFDSQTHNSSGDGTLGNGGPPLGGSVNNAGTFRKSTGTNVLQLSCDFNNAGLLDVQSGQVQVYAGTSTGTFNSDPGTELRFGAISGGARTNYLNAGVQFTGTNFVRFNQVSSTLMLNANVSLPNLSLENGILDGLGTLTVSNVFNWTGNATIQGAGAINLPAGSTFNITSTGQLIQRTINNAGTTIMTNAFPGPNTNAVFNNLAGGLLELHTGGGFGFLGTTPNPKPVLTNSGTVLDISGGTAPLAFNIFNQGTFLVRSNQLNCFTYQQNAGVTTISSNATLNPQGLLIQGGVVNGIGTINGTSASGFINSGGTLSPGNSPGILTMNNGTYTQMVAGALSIEIMGTNAGSQYSRLAANGGAILGGTLNVVFTNGFLPSLGDNYSIVTTPSFGGVMGTFSTLTGFRPGNGIVLVPVYGNFGVNLVAATDPVITSPAHSGNQFTFNFPTTTGLTNVVEYSDALNPPLWKPFATNTGDGTVKLATDPFATNSTRFYRVRFR